MLDMEPCNAIESRPDTIVTLSTFLCTSKPEGLASGFALALAQKVLQNSLFALDSLQSECMLIYTDIKLDNINESQVEDLSRTLLSPSPSPLERPSRPPLLAH